jgi:hypothetical protein
LKGNNLPWNVNQQFVQGWNMPPISNVYPSTLLIVSTRFKIVVMLGMLGNVKGTCIFVFKSNRSFWSFLHLHNLKYSHISFETTLVFYHGQQNHGCLLLQNCRFLQRC